MANLKKLLKSLKLKKDQIDLVVDFVNDNYVEKSEVKPRSKKSRSNCVVEINAKRKFLGSYKGATQMTETESSIADQDKGARP